MRPARDLRRLACCCLTLTLAGAGQGLPGRVITLDHNEETHGRLGQVSREEYTGQLAGMRTLVDACRSDAARCDPNAVAGDEFVGQPGFVVRWYWLRNAIDKARDPEANDRDETLEAAATRLQDETAQASAAGAAAAEAGALPDARKAAAQILNTAEFRRVHRNSWLQQRLAALSLILDRLFNGAAGLIPHSPWIATLVEWGLLALAAAGLMLWGWRAGRQQRLVVTASQSQSINRWQRESDDWAERARTQAAAGEWREAVHCLYWAAIVLLEAQKLWRQNRARTPREYLLLLEPGSPRQQALGGLTRVFERIWYGLRPASENDYTRAAALFDQLRAG